MPPTCQVLRCFTEATTVHTISPGSRRRIEAEDARDDDAYLSHFFDTGLERQMDRRQSPSYGAR